MPADSRSRTAASASAYLPNIPMTMYCMGSISVDLLRFSSLFHFTSNGRWSEPVAGIEEVHDDIRLVSFVDCDLGYFDLETRVLEPVANPFGPKLLPIVSGTLCHSCVRAGPRNVLVGPQGFEPWTNGL